MQRLDDLIQLRGLLQEAADSLCRTMIWDATRAKAPVLRITSCDARAGLLRFEIEAPVPVDAAWPEVSPIYISVFLPSMAVLCFVAEIRSRDSKELVVKFPERAFSLQRRKYLRYAIPGAYEFWAQVGPHRLKLIDLSTGGAGFAAYPSQSRTYAEGTVFSDVTLELQSTSVVVDLEVRNVRVLGSGPDEGKTLVATQFRSMDDASRERISEYLVRQWAQYPAFIEFFDIQRKQ